MEFRKMAEATAPRSHVMAVSGISPGLVARFDIAMHLASTDDPTVVKSPEVDESDLSGGNNGG